MDSFDEYKFFAANAQHLSERRQAASQTYLTVNTGILAVLALLVKDLGLRGWELVVVGLPLFLVGMLACCIWYKIVSQYRALSGWRYQQLREMEQAMPQSYHTYSKEWDDFYKPLMAGKRERFGFSRLEAWLPGLFLGLYAIYGVGLVVAVAFGVW
jgi:hypothetical protein